MENYYIYFIAFIVFDMVVLFFVFRFMRRRNTTTSNINAPTFDVKKGVSQHQQDFIIVNKTRETVINILKDIENYPTWRKDVQKITILSKTPLIYEEEIKKGIILKFEEINRPGYLISRKITHEIFLAPILLHFNVLQTKSISKDRRSQSKITLSVTTEIDVQGIMHNNLLFDKPTMIMIEKFSGGLAKSYGIGLQK